MAVRVRRLLVLDRHEAARRGREVIELTAEQIADALLAGGVDADNLDARIALVEAATNGPGDAIGWTRELAARVPLADSS